MQTNKGNKNRIWLVVIAVVLILAILAFALFMALGDDGATPATSSSASLQVIAPSVPPSEISGTDVLPDEMRAMWISYIEWQNYDISTESGMRTAATTMFDNCAAMGLNTVIVQVRPFGDALYQSTLFPWSHLLTGTQGQDPGYDPLAVLVEEAHARGLRIEAWLNPYRVRLSQELPASLSADNPAVLHADWTRTAGENGGLFYDPGLPEVRQLLIDGVLEIVQNYDVDGINMDDYFYPEGIDTSFDAESYALYGDGQDLADWRRENVNTLVRDLYASIKTADATMVFGIAPAGNPENNYQLYYADIQLWLANPDYVDYIMPQLYWGSGWQSGENTRFAFDSILEEWGSYTRDASVKLYAALGAYRIGVGDGSAGDQTEWSSGSNLARQVELVRANPNYSGFSLYRYENLYDGTELAQQETQALTALLTAS